MQSELKNSYDQQIKAKQLQKYLERQQEIAEEH
jgi:hypothetical protein